MSITTHTNTNIELNYSKIVSTENPQMRLRKMLLSQFCLSKIREYCNRFTQLKITVCSTIQTNLSYFANMSLH